MNMIDCIKIIDIELTEFKSMLGSISDLESSSSPKVVYGCQGIDFIVVVHRNHKEVTVGASYRVDGYKNRTYWVSYQTNECSSDEYDTEYTPNDEFNELVELIRKHT